MIAQDFINTLGPLKMQCSECTAVRAEQCSEVKCSEGRAVNDPTLETSRAEDRAVHCSHLEQ